MNKIIAPAAGFVVGIAACVAYHEIAMPGAPGAAQPVLEMRHAISQADGYIGNYLMNSQLPRIAETGWLINSSELLPFVQGAAYVHISLARVGRDESKVTLVVSGATKQYDHWFPTGPTPGDTTQPYVLETVHPCPICYDLRDDADPAKRVSERLNAQPDAVPRQ